MPLPTKRFKTALANVKTTLAGLATFQTLTGTASSDAAAKHIYDFAAPDDDSRDQPPRIILDIDSYDGQRRGGGFRGPVHVLVLHEYSIPSEYKTDREQAAWFWGQIEDWFDQFEAAVNGSGGLSVDSVEMSMSPGLVEPDDVPEDFENRHLWICQFRLEVQT